MPMKTLCLGHLITETSINNSNNSTCSLLRASVFGKYREKLIFVERSPQNLPLTILNLTINPLHDTQIQIKASDCSSHKYHSRILTMMRLNHTICVLLCFALVKATNRHLRGSETSRLSLSQAILGGGPIDPEDCPPMDAMEVCTDTNRTINCRGCKYESQCRALSAGFLLRRDCQIAALLVEDSTTDFSNNLNCPAVPPSNLCLDLIKPVSCSGCEYGHKCFAKEAGFDVENDCDSVATPPPVDESYINPVFLKNCPAPDSLVNCTGRNDTVLCGFEYCEYNSTCSAYAAGWNATFCQEPPFDQSLCPAISLAGENCSTTIDPFICQFCPYDNLCLASAAGYNETDCEQVVIEAEPEPEPEEELEPEIVDLSTCPKVFAGVLLSSCSSSIGDPVNCGGCVYNSTCLAAGAGFNIQLECQFRKPINKDVPAVVVKTPTCRNVTDDTICPDVLESVYCESCEYENSCLAEAAGYNVTECQLTPPEAVTEEDVPPVILPDLEVCPPITNSIPCTGGSKPVLCRGCEYENRCFAAGAGLNGEDCKVIIPPSPPTATPTAAPAVAAVNISESVDAVEIEVEIEVEAEDLATPEPYVCPSIQPNLCFALKTPVICNDLCAYDNACLANSAGFARSQCESNAGSGNSGGNSGGNFIGQSAGNFGGGGSFGGFGGQP
jgi:hypothetical protein